MEEVIQSLGIQMVYAQEGEQVDYDKVKMMSEEGFEAFYAGMKGRAIAKQVKEFYSQYEGQTWKNIISIGDSSFERLGTLQATKEYLKSEGAEVNLDTIDKSKQERKVFVTDAIEESPRSPLCSSIGSEISENESTVSPQAVRGSEVPALRSSEVILDGHVYHVRTKVFKMLDEPTIDELITELELLRTWLLKMVRFPNSFDLDLKALDNKEDIHAIETALRKHP